MVSLALEILLSAAVLASLSSAQVPGSNTLNEGVLATRINLVVVDVVAQDKKDGKPLEGLRAEDFEIHDNGALATIHYFRHAPESSEYPITLWLVAVCSLKSQGRNGPAILPGSLLEQTKKQLNPEDKVGVAHWCPDIGKSGIDLAATKDAHGQTEALNAAMAHDSGESHSSIGSLRGILSLIHRQTSDSDREPRPVVVFLGSRGVGFPRGETTELAREIVSRTSLTLYAIDDQVQHGPAISSFRRSSVARLCEETGGQVVFTSGANWADAVGRIVDGFHSRYLIAYLPPKYDLNWHAVSIRLTGEAIRKSGSVLLRYRSGYSGSSNPPRYSIAEQTRGSDFSLDSSMSEVVAGVMGSSEIPFEVEGATYEGPSRTAKLTLKMGDDRALSWTPLSNGSHRSEITILIAFLSPKGETIGRKVKAYQIVRRPTDSWTLLNQRIVIDTFLEYPAEADRVRFAIRDDAAGRIGTQDVPMRKILDAPKLRAVIY